MKYYVVFEPKDAKGVYRSWDECKVVVAGVRGAVYCSYKTEEQARAALRAGSMMRARANEAKVKASKWRKEVEMPCIAVDAACSGCPGPVEYRGVVLPTMCLFCHLSSYLTLSATGSRRFDAARTLREPTTSESSWP
jgi:ribonuclease HI